MVRRAAWALVSVLALVACGADTRPAATEAEEPDVPADEIELDRAAIAASEAAWIAARPAAYAYVVETQCECFLAGTYGVTVEGEEALEVVSQDPEAEPYRTYSPPLIDRAFAMLDEPLTLAADGEIPSGEASAAFDPLYGYPLSFTVTGSGGLPSFHGEIRDFTPIEPDDLIRPPPGLALIVSNQSFDDPDVALTISVDGEVMVDRAFAVEGQHTYIDYQLPLEPGDHRVLVRADTGVTLERIVRLGAQKRFLAISYWGTSEPRPFSVNESDEPFGIA